MEFLLVHVVQNVGNVELPANDFLGYCLFSFSDHMLTLHQDALGI